MALIDVNLVEGGTTTINSENWGGGGDTAELNLVSSGTLIVDGVDFNISNVLGIGAISNTTINAINGAHVTVNAGLANAAAGSTFTYNIGASSTVEIQAAALDVGLLNNVTINFDAADGTGTFVFDPPTVALNLSTPPTLINMIPGDKVVVPGAENVTFNDANNQLTFTAGLLGLPVATFTIPEGVTFEYNESTGTVEFTSCFLRGTLIRTPEGDIPVEDLRVGDLVVTYNGEGVSEIKWVGRRMLDPKAVDKPRDTLPVRIKAGAIAENVPERDLLVSPDHCMFFENSLIPAKFLVNGTTIIQEMMLTPFEYYHIELEHHNIVLAEGALTETYLDLGGRASFLNPGVVQFGAFAAARSWKDWCYPPVYAGAVLQDVRASLIKRAEELGYAVEEAKAS